MEAGTNAKTLWNLLYGENTRSSSPRLWAISVEGQLMGYVITIDFYQATYITCLQINEADRGEGFGSMLLKHICNDPNRTYVLISDVAMSDSEQLSICVRRKMFIWKTVSEQLLSSGIANTIINMMSMSKVWTWNLDPCWQYWEKVERFGTPRTFRIL